MYDNSQCGLLLRRYMSLSLAWWHNYKWTTKMIIRVFSNDFIMPLFHHLFPDRGFAIDKVGHTALCTYLSYIRLSYPGFREQLNTALRRDGLRDSQRVLLTNLRDLCEFFIPVVIIFVIYSHTTHTNLI